VHPCYDHTEIVIVGEIPFSDLVRRGLYEHDQAGYIVGCLYRRSDRHKGWRDTAFEERTNNSSSTT
jgi:hypothetical protein